MASGLVLPWPGVPTDNPPGVGEALRAIPGAVAGLVACWAYGSRRMRSYTPP